MAGLGGVFGEGSTARQLLVWQVLAQVIGSLAAPGFTELQKLAYRTAPVVPLAPGDAAAAAARGLLTKGQAEDAARDSGIDSDVLTTMRKLAARAPDLSITFELYRRKIIGKGDGNPEGVGLRNALTDAGIIPEWHDLIEKLATAIPTTAEVMNAWLEGQIDKGEARRRYLEAGGDPTWFQTAYNANGQAPTPTQALELLNRGIIPERGTGPGAVSYEQAFLEGPWRNKWLAPFLALAEYLPPPRTITAMFHGGQLTHDRAAELLRKQGLAADLAQAYLAKSASTTHATEKHLAKSEITKAYADGLMTHGQAVKALVDLKYTAHDAALILDLVHVAVKTSELNKGITRVRALFQAGKVTEQEASALLGKLGVDADQRRGIIATWRLTRNVTTKTLTPAQIESAWYYELLTTRDAMTLLQAAGYDEFDAWVALSVRNKRALSDYPRPSSPFPAPKRKAP